MPTEIPAPNDANNSPSSRVDEAAFFVVSARKLFLLDMASLGLYKVYWFYRNWQVYSAREQKPVAAFWRALLAGIFSFFLFDYIERAARRVGVQALIPAWFLALSILGFSALSMVPNALGLLGALMILPVLYANNLAHRVNYQHDAGFIADDTLSPPQRMLLVLGAMIWTLVIIGVIQAPVAVSTP